MTIVKALLKKLDGCLDSSKRLFDQEYATLAKRQKETGGTEKIAFSTGEQLNAACISCNKEIVTYSISGKWEEDNLEGIGEINWKCGLCKKTFSLKGSRSKVADRLIRMTEEVMG
jgi:hypothetical protein